MYVVVVLVVMLTVVSGQYTKKYSGLTKCIILNGSATADTLLTNMVVEKNLGSYLHSTH